MIRLIFVLQRLLKKKKQNYSISAEDWYKRKKINVLESEMAYIDVGHGDPIVFLHGNPTSSYLWRNIIPKVEDLGRCLAPDLIGMGKSGRSDKGSYRLEDHIRYLDTWFDKLELEDVTLVVHDWGSALGFYWANRNPDKVKGIVYMEAFVRPVSWKEWPLLARPIFKLLRSTIGEKFILLHNGFVQLILPSGVIRELSEVEMDTYRDPYPNKGEGRRPMLTWAREVPLDGTPEDVYKIMDQYATWLSICNLPKLFINAEPGLILTGQQREFCRNWPNQKEITVKGLHFVQEDSPKEIGEAVAEFIKGLNSLKNK